MTGEPKFADSLDHRSVALRGPIDLDASLRPFGRWGDDGLDRWDGTHLVRTVRVESAGAVPYVAQVSGSVERPSLEVAISPAAAAHGERVVAAVRATFATAPAGALAALAAADGRVGELVRRYPGLVPIIVPDPFSALVRSISAQQVNLPWAATIRRRLAERYGVRHELGDTYVYALHPEPLADAAADELRALQLTTAKARSVIEVAQAAVAGELASTDLDALDDEALIGHLTRLRGIGRWSAEWFLARTLGRPRVVAGDLGVRKAVGRLYDAGALPAEEEVRRLTAHWGQAAAMIQALALHDLAAPTGAA